MKPLADILEKVAVSAWRGEKAREIREIHFDSRLAGEEDMFVAISGTKVDGHTFIDTVKAQVIVCERLPETIKEDRTYIRVSNCRKALALMLHAYHEYPASQLAVVGVTGTNGKSSTVTLLYRLFESLGLRSGLISTIENRIGDLVLPATHTTPDPKQLVQLFDQMVQAGCLYCFMEVSSHALDQDRTAGIPFAVGVFTNITHDHLDYHQTFKAYIQAKKRLFDDLGKNALALVNLDDKHARVMVQNCAARVKTLALKRVADFKGQLLENTFHGLHLRLDGHDAWFRLLGGYNAYNLLTAYAVAHELGEASPGQIIRALSALSGIPGRFEPVNDGGRIHGIVDYAHTPDALENVLTTIGEMNQEQLPLIVVVGCGGDRDKAKRPKMGALSAALADRVVLTADNPRSEDPSLIIDQMMAGIAQKDRKKVWQHPGRREAIRMACRLVDGPCIVLVAGKGHETYQEIAGSRYPFDDREELLSAIREVET